MGGSNQSDAQWREKEGKWGSASFLNRKTSNASLLKRALSFQFLNKDEEGTDMKTRAFIRRRYKDIAKTEIWPSCPLPEGFTDSKYTQQGPSSPIKHNPVDPRAILMKPELEDHRSPYLPCTINQILRSDSEGSSDEEDVMQMTRL